MTQEVHMIVVTILLHKPLRATIVGGRNGFPTTHNERSSDILAFYAIKQI